MAASCVGLRGSTRPVVSRVYDVRPPCVGLGMLFFAVLFAFRRWFCLGDLHTHPRDWAFELYGLAANAVRVRSLVSDYASFFQLLFLVMLLVSSLAH